MDRKLSKSLESAHGFLRGSKVLDNQPYGLLDG
jgi:hypothetical protein